MKAERSLDIRLNSDVVATSQSRIWKLIGAITETELVCGSGMNRVGAGN